MMSKRLRWIVLTVMALPLFAGAGQVQALTIAQMLGPDTTIDALITFGSGTAFTGTTLLAAVTAIGTTSPVVLKVRPGTWTVSANLTIPSNIVFRVPAGAILSVSSGKTLTINGPLEAGPYTIFSGSGTVALAGLTPVVRPEWWGAKADATTASATAIQAAIDCAGAFYGEVELSAGIYKIATTLNITNRIILRGRGSGHPTAAGYRYGTMLEKSADVLGIQIKSGAFYTILKDFTLYAALTADTTGGIRIGETDGTNGAGHCRLENIWVQGMGGVGILINNGNVGRMTGITSNYNDSHGIQLDSTHTSLPNANAWTLVDVDTVGNGGDGLHIGVSPANTVVGLVSEGNTGFGLYVNRAYQKILGHCDVGNVAGSVSLGGNAFDCFIAVSSAEYTYTVGNSNNFWLALDGQGHTPYVRPDTGILKSRNGIHLYYGADLKGYTDNENTLLYTLAGATGNLTTPGTVEAATGKATNLLHKGTALTSGDFVVSSEWGSGAVLSLAANGYKNKFYIGITAGTSPSVYATITYTPPEAFLGSPVAFAQMVAGNGAINPLAIYAAGGGAWSIKYMGTPVEGQVYDFSVFFAE